MENTQRRLSPAKSIVIAVASLLVIFLGVLVVKAPTVGVLIFAGLVTMCFSLIWGVKWDDIMEDILEMAKRMFPALLILIFVGMLVGAWMISGTVPMMIYWGLKLISPRFFLVTGCVLCAIMSIMTGTSWGTISTVGVALMGVAAGLGVPAPMAAGAVIVGALFGDKLSPISDTTVLAPTVSGVNVIDHIKYESMTTVPSFLISLIFFLVLGLRFGHGSIQSEDYTLILTTLEQNFHFNPLLLVPPVVVLFLIFRQKPILPVFAVGIVLGGVLAMIFQGVSLGDVAAALNKGFTASTQVAIVDTMICRGGISSMLSSVAVIIAAALFGAPLKTSGVIQLLVDVIQKFARGQKSLLFLSYLFHGLLICTIGGYYTTFSIAGPILQPLFEKKGLDKRNLSRMLEDSGTTFSPLVPWSSNGVYMSGMLGVTVAQYALFSPLCWLCLVFAAIYIATGFKIAQAPTPQEPERV